MPSPATVAPAPRTLLGQCGSTSPHTLRRSVAYVAAGACADVVEPRELALRIAELACPRGSTPAERRPELRLVDETMQRFREPGGVPWRDESSTAVIDDLAGPSQIRGHDGPARRQCLDEHHAERLRLDVRLAMDVGGCEQSRHVRPLPEEVNACRDGQRLGHRAKSTHVRHLLLSLRRSGDPAYPSWIVAHARERGQQLRVSLPGLHATVLYDHHG